MSSTPGTSRSKEKSENVEGKAGNLGTERDRASRRKRTNRVVHSSIQPSTHLEEISVNKEAPDASNMTSVVKKSSSPKELQPSSNHVSVKTIDEVVDENIKTTLKTLSPKETPKSKKQKTPSKGKLKSSRRNNKRFIELKRVGSWNGANGAALDDEPFYHGYMAREEATRLLKKQGEFLVRKAVVKKVECVVVSVYFNEKCHHLAIQRTKSKNYYLLEYCFETVPDLIRYHQQTHKPVYKDGVSLFNWIQREQWQLYHEQVNLGKKLGNGEFGEVFRGSLTLGLFTKPADVAVKTLKGNHLSTDDKITFLREANLMLKLNHKYVVKLYGVATQKEPIMIVMELCPGGSLVEAIRKPDQVCLETKRKYCLQVLSGMAYLDKEQVFLVLHLEWIE
ncbi:unnamed protein product [Caenorhabditis auriculariae]|uniref:Tyrosine-protein kinase n=1 Tax=Caenorhabditis auriculariae TaxID=2777116 RepID=A0A8S1GNY7_9PELO|nr:unnamed protein product [Caenorhabditis auriculariae]